MKKVATYNWRHLKPFPKQALVFTCLQYKSFENTVGKGEIARSEQFLVFPQYFLSFRTTFCHFHQLYNCRLQSLSIRKSLKFVAWERVKLLIISRPIRYNSVHSVTTSASVYQMKNIHPLLSSSIKPFVIITLDTI